MQIKKILGMQKKYALDDGRIVDIIDYNQGLIKPIYEKQEIKQPEDEIKKRGRKKMFGGE